MICPECKKEGKRKTGFSTFTSIPPFYKDGKYHSGNVEVERYGCSGGHEWWEIVPENVSPLYIGKDAGKDVTGERKDMSAGPIAGMSGDTTKCLLNYPISVLQAEAGKLSIPLNLSGEESVKRINKLNEIIRAVNILHVEKRKDEERKEIYGFTVDKKYKTLKRKI